VGAENRGLGCCWMLHCLAVWQPSVLCLSSLHWTLNRLPGAATRCTSSGLGGRHGSSMAVAIAFIHDHTMAIRQRQARWQTSPDAERCSCRTAGVAGNARPSRASHCHVEANSTRRTVQRRRP
jgi:hypothetical protein